MSQREETAQRHHHGITTELYSCNFFALLMYFLCYFIYFSFLFQFYKLDEPERTDGTVASLRYQFRYFSHFFALFLFLFDVILLIFLLFYKLDEPDRRDGQTCPRDHLLAVKY